MVVKILCDVGLGSHVFEFANFSFYIGYFENVDGRWAVVDLDGITLSFPEVVFDFPKEGKQTKLIKGWQTLDNSSPGFGIAFDSKAYIMENGETVDRF